MKDTSQEQHDFRLPKEVIDRSIAMHNMPPESPLKDRRKDILKKVRTQKLPQKVLIAVMTAAAALLLALLYFPGKQTMNDQMHATKELEQWLLEDAIIGEPIEYSLGDHMDETTIDWYWSGQLNLSDDQVDLLLHEWSIEMTANEIYNLEKL